MLHKKVLIFTICFFCPVICQNYTKSKPIFKDGTYTNPWATWTGFPTVLDAIKLKWASREEDYPKPDLDKELKIVKPHFLPNPKSGLIATWLGHSTVLVQMEGKAFLTDPIANLRASPIFFVGPKRLRKFPCEISDLPKLDAILLSHNHFDHLDEGTVEKINERYGNKLRWYVPVGVKGWLLNQGVTNVIEKSWWEEEIMPNTNMKIVSLPTQHWSTRNWWDKNKSLWCSWAVKGETESFYFTGDTGYCDEFKAIGHYYGPFTFSAIPIGCYKPRWFMKPLHVDPTDAVQIHKDIKSQNSLGIHWGTYAMGCKEAFLAPRRDLAAQVAKANLTSGNFFTLYHGQSWFSNGTK